MEQVRESRRTEKKPGNAKKKRVFTERVVFKVVDVTRKQTRITPAEEEELQKAKHSWIAGRPVIPFGAIDWDNPPSDEEIILARIPVGGHTRTLRSERYKEENRGKAITIDPYEKPRMPDLFGTWKANRTALHPRAGQPVRGTAGTARPDGA